jgi:hypothetical protein
MKLYKVIVNTALLLSMLVSILTVGMAKIFKLYDLMEVHGIAGLFIVITVTLHVIMNFKVYLFHWKQLKKK